MRLLPRETRLLTRETRIETRLSSRKRVVTNTFEWYYMYVQDGDVINEDTYNNCNDSWNDSMCVSVRQE